MKKRILAVILLLGMLATLLAACGTPKPAETPAPVGPGTYAGEYGKWVGASDEDRDTEPFTLVLLDHHPDDQAPALGEILSCGGWVRDLRRDCPALEGVIAVGPEGAIQTVEEFRSAFRDAAPARVPFSSLATPFSF